MKLYSLVRISFLALLWILALVAGAGARTRRLQQSTTTKFVQLNTARLTNYPVNLVDNNCPIFVICSINTTRSPVPDRTTCISESVGQVISEGVWIYSRNQDTIPPFSVNLLQNETIQCRFSVRVDGFISFYEFENRVEACKFKFEDFDENPIQFCRLENEGDFSLTTEQDQVSSDDNNNNLPRMRFPDIGLNQNTMRDGVLVGVILILLGSGCVLICRSNFIGTSNDTQDVEEELERRDTQGSSPTVFEAGSPQSKASSSKKNWKGPILFLNPSSFTNPKQWFTNRLFMLGEPETYSNPPNTPKQPQYTGAVELEMSNRNQTSS